MTSTHTTEYFYTPALKGLAQQLVHLAFFGDGLSVVVGQRGSGKSALASEILGHLGQAHHIASVSFTEDLALSDFLERISTTLGIPLSESLSAGEMLAELRHYVQALTQEKKLAVLVVDDAHFMDDQSIGALISLIQGRFESNIGLHLILFSEPGLDSRIDALQIVDVAVYDFAIPNFSPSELGNFLRAYASDDAENIGSPEIQKAWAHSKGFPGLALDFIDNRLDDTEPEGAKYPLKLPLMHIAAVVALVIILVAVLLFRNSEQESIVADNDEIPIPTPTPLKYEPQGRTSIPIVAQDDNPKDVNQIGENPYRDNVVGAGSLSSEEVIIEQDIASVASGVGSTANKLEEQNSQLSPSPMAEIFDESPEPEPTPQIALSQVQLSDSEAFLMSQDPNHYVLQVIATSNRSSLDTYMARQQNKDSLKMYRGEREGKRWYVVVQGVYKTRNLALNARNTLPDEQAKAGPWPRKLSSIKQEIENFRLN